MQTAGPPAATHGYATALLVPPWIASIVAKTGSRSPAGLTQPLRYFFFLADFFFTAFFAVFFFAAFFFIAMMYSFIMRFKG